MNKIWKVLIISSLIFGFINNRSDIMINKLLETPLNVLELVVTIVVNGCLWNGFLNIAKEAGLLEKLSRVFLPVLSFIYRDIDRDDEVFNYISTNLVSNLFGLGALATMSGLKAIKRLNILNQYHDEPSRSMMTLMIFNTTGLSFFPITILSIRQSYGSQNPSDFIPYIIIIGFITLAIGLIIQKVIEHD